jgi:molecular chaperone IbpA
MTEGVQLEHGLLTIELKREVPEALKPRRIELSSGSGDRGVAQSNVTTLDQAKVA